MSLESTSRVARHKESVPRAAALVGIGFSGLALLGWALDLPVLNRWFPSLPPMVPNTALLTLLVSVTLWLSETRRTVAARRLADGLALLVAVAGAFFLAEHLFAFTTGLDTWLLDLLQRIHLSDYPGRPAPQSALSVVCLGLALWLARRDEPWRVLVSQALAALVLLVAALALVGYTYRWTMLYEFSASNGIAVPTTLALIAVSLGVLYLHPERGAMTLVLSDDPAGILVRRLAPAAIIIPFVLGLLRILAEQAGVVDMPSALALLVVTNMLVFLGLIAWSAVSIRELDSRRRQADAARALQIVRAETEQAARRTTEQAMERTRRLQEVTAALSQAPDRRQVIDVIVQQGRAALDADLGTVTLLSDDGQSLEYAGSLGYPPGLPDWRQLPLSQAAPMADAVRSGRPILLETDVALSTRYPHLTTVPTAMGLQAYAAIPMLAQGRPVGALALGFYHPHSFSAEDTGFMLALAQLGGQALERARLFDAEQRAHAEAERERARAALLADVSRVLTSSLDSEATLSQAAHLLIPRLGDGCLIHILDEDGQVIWAALAHRDAAKEALLHELPAITELRRASTHPIAVAMRTGRPYVVADLPAELGRASAVDPRVRRILGQLGVASQATLPLIAHDRTLGGLTLMSEQPDFYTAAELSLMTEIAQRAAIAVENAQLYAAAQTAVRIRDEFISITSHELKNPLTAVNGFIQYLARHARRDTLASLPREQVVQTLALAADQVRQLDRLIDDLRDVSRLRAGRLELELSDVDLTSLVASVVERHRERAVNAGSRLEFVDSLPIIGRWDRLRVDQIVTNLVSNAIKYGAGRPIVVSVSVAGGKALVKVADQGIGIKAEDLERIFDPFERAASEQRAISLGLGLYIARRLTEAHGGRLSVASKVGVGSTFTAELPLPA